MKSPRNSPLADRLCTDDVLRSFVWAFWRVGKRDKGALSKQIDRWIKRSPESELLDLIRSYYEHGVAGKDFIVGGPSLAARGLPKTQDACESNEPTDQATQDPPHKRTR